MIDRPIAEVFALLADGENDPKLSARVIEIATTRGRMMIRFALTLLVAVGVAALPASAAALAPGTLSPLACVVDNDPPADQSACARSGDALDGLDDIAISPDGRNVYAPTSSADALTRLVRAADGSLVFAGCIEDNDTGSDDCAASTDGLDNVRSAVVSPDGRQVYAVSKVDDAIVRFDRAADGSLTAAGCVDDNDAGSGPDACAASTDGMNGPESVDISPDGRSVYVVTDGDNAVVRFDRDLITGALTAAGCVEDNDSGPDACGAAAPGLDGGDDVAVSPDGRSVYATSNADGDSALVRFDRASGGALTPQDCTDDVDAAESPETCAATAEGLADIERLALSPDGSSVYTVAGADGAIAQFDRNTVTGVLTAVTCFGGDDCPDVVPTMFGAQGVAVSPAGDVVYVTEAGTKAVRSFRRASDGSLSPAGCVELPVAVGCTQSATLGLPRAVVVSPDGRRVYVADDGTRAVLSFATEEPPVCIGRASTGAPGAVQTVALDCSDLNGDALTLEIVRAPANGSLGAIDQGADTAAYTPNPGFAGEDSFAFRAVADGAASPAVTATISVGSAIGPIGPIGPTGPTGPSGAAGTPAVRLLALFGLDRFTATSGKSARFRIAATAPGTARVRILKGKTARVTLTKAIAKAGRAAVAWNGKAKVKGKRKPLAAGRYTLELVVTGSDGQKARDTARLTVAKAKRKR